MQVTPAQQGTSTEQKAARALLELAQRVAHLNPSVGTIGAGMLASLVADAQAALQLAGCAA